MNDPDREVLRAALELARAENTLDVPSIARLLGDETTESTARKWADLLGLWSDPQADRILFETLDPDRPIPCAAAVSALQFRGTKILPDLWKPLESSDPAIQELGRQILDRLVFREESLDALIGLYREGSSRRRNWIEHHLQQNRAEARVALLRRLDPRTPPGIRFTRQILLAILEDDPERSPQEAHRPSSTPQPPIQ